MMVNFLNEERTCIFDFSIWQFHHFTIGLVIWDGESKGIEKIDKFVKLTLTSCNYPGHTRCESRDRTCDNSSGFNFWIQSCLFVLEKTAFHGRCNQNL